MSAGEGRGGIEAVGGMASKGGVICCPGVEKVKFTVSVRGHQWSSARHVHETLQEFARVIERNARRLEFIGEGDSIQRLQLANADGSEPEDLDVDATLEDVIICMGSKQLVAIVNSTKVSPVCNNRPETEKLGPASPMVLASLQKPKTKSDTTINNHSLATPTSAPDAAAHDQESPTFGPKLMPPPHKPSRAAHLKPSNDVPARGLKITIPPSDPAPVSFPKDRCTFHQDYSCERHAGHLPPMLASRSNSFNNGGVRMCGKGMQAGSVFSSSSTPSPAELAQFLVRGSSHPNRAGGAGCMHGPIVPQCNRSMPNGGFQSFASALLSRLPVMPTSNLHSAQAATPNIALLAQFLASQLRAFVPVEGNAHPSAEAVPLCPGVDRTVLTKEATPINTEPPDQKNGQALELEMYPEMGGTLLENGSPKVAVGNVKLSVSGSPDKDESSSSANVNTAAAPSSDGIDSEQINGRSELIFLVNRRSKTGVGTHHLKMSDLSAYFHLSVVDAAKKLGVSQTTLKKACRKFGLKRWPGRKVRSLESTIHGLEHTIAVGQGAGMEELTEAYMRSEVTKLQQEMDQLVHGTPAQHSPVVRTADLYKRLYSRGWRSKYHSPCSRFELDLNNASHDNEMSHCAKKGTDAAKVVNSGCKVQEVPVLNQQENSNKIQKAFTKEDLPIQTTGAVKDTIKENTTEAPLNKEAHVQMSVPTAVVDNGATANCNNASDKVSSERRVFTEEKDKSLPPERSPKRPKRECRNVAEAGRQGLRSGTCAT